jgi:NADH-quinone oxidoreductase subunit G
MPKLTVNGVPVEVPQGATVLQACEAAGFEIPRFCYHERLSIAGNCRMCLVEQEKAPKPIASCAMPAADNMVIKTNSPMAQKARKGVMEFLLINHPLDCPICDQGGECDLQDQAMAYGFDHSRYQENKRAVADKDLGPLVRTSMNRCIHCTRCVRFATEVAGIEELGAVHRGEHMEITTYVEKSLSSELSANIVDLCPVGALTSKPYAFVARPWELRKTESIDVMDAVGSNIRVDSRSGEVLRVLPRVNEDVNEEWISDKARFAIDGLKRQRLDRPYIRGADGKLKPASWSDAFARIAERLAAVPGQRWAAIAGDLADVEAMTALKDLLTSFGSPHLDCRQDGSAIDPGNPVGWRFNTTIAGIERADALLLVGTNPRYEAPIINARIRKRWLAGKFPIAVIGPQLDLTYRYDYLGAGPTTLSELADGRLGAAETMRQAERPMMILGPGALARGDGAAVQALARRAAMQLGMVKDGWNGFNVLHSAAARVGGLEIGFVPGENGRDVRGILDGCASGEIEAVWLLGADEIDPARLGKAFVVYQGTHGDRGAHRADVILPGAAYTEKNATYVNTEGRVQHTRLAIFPPGDAKEDWKILRALSQIAAKRLPYDSLEALRARMTRLNPIFGGAGGIAPASWTAFGRDGAVDGAPFRSPIENFFMTCAVSRASPTMAACTEARRAALGGRTGTHA